MNLKLGMKNFASLVLTSTLLCAIGATLPSSAMLPAAHAAPVPADASIVVSGNVLSGRLYRAYRIADYVNVVIRNDKPVGTELATAATGDNSSVITFCDGTSANTLNFKQALGREITCLEDARNGADPAPNLDGNTGSIDNLDPLVWATTFWQRGVDSDTVDPWLNTNTQAAGPMRSLADWLYANVVEDAGCVAGTDPQCFGMPNVSETRATLSGDAGNPAQATFDSIEPGLYLMYQVEEQPAPEGNEGVTSVPAMIVGTKIPIEVNGERKFYDMYDVTGTKVHHELGVLNAKGDEVAISIEIDDAYKRAHPTFGIGDTVPYIVTATLPNFDGFAAQGGNGSYSGGVLPSKVMQPKSLSAPTITSTVFRQGSATVHLADDAPVLNPVRFDVAIDFSSAFSNPDAAGTVPGLADMEVQVASTVLHYSASCVLGTANTGDPCFAYRQGTPNAAGETTVLIQIPSWVLRANGGGNVVIRYAQHMLHTINDDDASPLEAFDEVDGGPGSEDWAVASATFSSNPYGEDYTDFGVSRSYATAKARDLSVFTFPLTITKIDSNSNVTLPGAEFSVKRDGTLECFTLMGGVYMRTSQAPCQNGSTGVLKADSSGRVLVKGLEAHVDYQVQESKQPEGYDAGNMKMVDFTVRIEPVYNSDARPTEVLATEYRYADATYMHPRSLPAYLRPATTEWVNDVDHVKHTYYAHEIDVLNGKTSRDVDAIAPFPWDVLAKTGEGVLGFILLAGFLLILGILLKRRREAGKQPERVGEIGA